MVMETYSLTQSKKRVLNNLFSSKLSSCLSHLILLALILESTWANTFSVLSTFTMLLKCVVLLRFLKSHTSVSFQTT